MTDTIDPLSKALHALRHAKIELKDADSYLKSKGTARELNKVKEALSIVENIIDDMEFERRKWV